MAFQITHSAIANRVGKNKQVKTLHRLFSLLTNQFSGYVGRALGRSLVVNWILVRSP